MCGRYAVGVAAVRLIRIGLRAFRINDAGGACFFFLQPPPRHTSDGRDWDCYSDVDSCRILNAFSIFN